MSNEWQQKVKFLLLEMASALREMARVLRLTPRYMLMLWRAEMNLDRERPRRFLMRKSRYCRYDYQDVMVRLNRYAWVNRVDIECFDYLYRDSLRKYLQSRGFKTQLNGLIVTVVR